jgi:hypothetical protein
MQKFTIEVSITTTKSVILFMEPSKEVMNVAKILSAAYLGSIVSVRMFARARRVYKNNRMTDSRPDLESFYSNTTKEDKHAWACLGQVKD